MPYLLGAARIRFQAWSRSSSVAPSTWSNRAIAFQAPLWLPHRQDTQGALFTFHHPGLN